MSSENFHKFRTIVLTDEVLQTRLGDISDRDEFVAKVMELARINNLEFDESVLIEEMMKGRREWIERWI